MLLDLLLLDIATHLQKGNFGATHGRSYMKDKSLATDQDTFGLAKLLFADTNLPYEGGGDPGAVLAARAHKYRLPEVIRRIAVSTKTTIDRERMGVKFNPNAPVDLTAPAPYGFDFNDPKNLAFWWERGSQTTWQGVEATLNTLTKNNLWNTEAFSPFIPLRDLVHNNPVEARPLAQRLAPMLALGVLAEVNTYTYREPDVMLSSAQDYRFGMFSQQAHAWQATLDEKAIVFTTHPKNEPRVNAQWPDGDGYFTGSGSLPATAQQGPASINIYNPAFVAPGETGALSSFNYLNYTHAYFPQEYFDEVQQDAHWVFGRKGNGYVGLWSQRIPEWRPAPTGTFTHGLQRPFDLVARGGANNVWIAEVGGAEKYKTFAAFKQALVASSPTVTGGNEIPDPSPITVTYASPGAGLMSFMASHRAPGALSVNGTQTAIADYKRFDNPWMTADFQTHTFTTSDGTATLSLDFDHARRAAAATTG